MTRPAPSTWTTPSWPWVMARWTDKTSGWLKTGDTSPLPWPTNTHTHTQRKWNREAKQLLYTGFGQYFLLCTKDTISQNLWLTSSGQSQDFHFVEWGRKVFISQHLLHKKHHNFSIVCCSTCPACSSFSALWFHPTASISLTLTVLWVYLNRFIKWSPVMGHDAAFT